MAKLPVPARRSASAIAQRRLLTTATHRPHPSAFPDTGSWRGLTIQVCATGKMICPSTQSRPHPGICRSEEAIVSSCSCASARVPCGRAYVIFSIAILASAVVWSSGIGTRLASISTKSGIELSSSWSLSLSRWLMSWPSRPELFSKR